MKRSNTIIIATIIILIIILCGCYKKPDIIEGEGIIVYNDFEGGFYGILSNEGDKYDPINLPLSFQQDGINISYSIKILGNESNVHNWGTAIEIISIQELPV
jgi:hypothetical protein